MLGEGCQVRVAATHFFFAISYTSSRAAHSAEEHLANNQGQKLLRQQGACSNMSKHVRIRPDKHIKETEIKHVSRPPEARSKVLATATVHAQTCQNMSGYDLPNISKKQKSNMSVDLLKQDQKL